MRKNLFISIIGLLVSAVLFAQGPGRMGPEIEL